MRIRLFRLSDREEWTYLSDDGTEFTRSGRDTVSGRSVTSREDFSGNDEGSSVGSKVLHKVGSAVLFETIQGHQYRLQA